MATAASFITLALYQGHPLPDWPYNITIGALLSVYSVKLRGTATFLLAEGLSHLKWRWFGKHERPLHDLSLHDEAAQGPIGAVTLLWRLRFLPSTWQWLGCLLIPITLLAGPFTQQALQYVSCSVLADTSTPQYTIPRNSFFLSGAYRYDSFQLDLAQQVSINTGMYSPSHVEVECETGNCTSKSTYSSIGFCARCEDISSQVSVDSKWDPGNGLGNATTSLPTGLAVHFTLQNLELATMGERPYDEESRYGSLDVLIGKLGDRYTWDRSNCSDVSTNNTWRCQGYGAANCEIYPCVRTYNTSIDNGVFQEDIVEETEAFGDAGDWPGVYPANILSAIDTKCLDEDEWDFSQQIDYSINPAQRWLPYNLTGKPSEVDTWQFENKIIERGCLYAIDGNFKIGVSRYLSSQFKGNLTGTPKAFSTLITEITGNQLLQTIYNYGNYSFERTQSIFQNMSISLTSQIRMNRGVEDFNNTTYPAIGNTYITKTCVAVRWAWLSLPLAVTSLTLLFFCGVIVASTHLPREVRSWKSSPLPLLFHGPDLAAYKDNVYIEDIDEVSKEIKFKLESDLEGRIELKEQNSVSG